MSEVETDRIERHLRGVLEKERRDALTYAILTVLGMPVFVAGASLLVGLVVLAATPKSWNSSTAVYVGFSGFLAYMIAFVLTGGTCPLRIGVPDPLCLLAAGLGAGLMLLAFLTPVRDWLPMAFGVFYATCAFVILGLLGRAWMKRPICEEVNAQDVHCSLVALVSGFVVLAYGEVLRSSWLWVPPTDDEIRLGAWLLSKLAADPNTALGGEAVQGRMFDLLIRLKLIGLTEAGAALTPKGLEFIRAAGETET